MGRSSSASVSLTVRLHWCQAVHGREGRRATLIIYFNLALIRDCGSREADFVVSGAEQREWQAHKEKAGRATTRPSLTRMRRSRRRVLQPPRLAIDRHTAASPSPDYPKSRVSSR